VRRDRDLTIAAVWPRAPACADENGCRMARWAGFRRRPTLRFPLASAAVALTSGREDRWRRLGDQLVAEAVTGGDAPTVVAQAILTAATAHKPRLRSTAGPFARRLSLLRRIAPTRVFDQQIRKFNKLAA
jgi:hypothetical protein